MAKRVRIGIIGAGKVSDYHHVPGIRIDHRAELAGVCDADPKLVENRCREWGCDFGTTNVDEMCRSPNVDAVIIATPNFTHRPISLTAIENGKHVMCEKPLGLNAQEVRDMYHAARDRSVVHMTAFTYRFAPAMRYIKHLLDKGSLGVPRHFRSQRFLDWPETSWGWRQYQDKAGAGDLFDMTIHRIDFAIDLLGPIDQICGAVKRFTKRDITTDGKKCPPSEVDDWSSIIGEFRGGAVGVWEGTTLAKGYGLNGFGHEWAEVNGSEQSAVYQLHRPNQILLGATGRDLTSVDVPESLLKPASSPRDPRTGEPSTVFRYDLVWEFVSAIVEGRDAVPSFYDGLRAQIIADATLQSHADRRWITIPDESR